MLPDRDGTFLWGFKERDPGMVLKMILLMLCREILTLADGGEVALDWGTMKDPSQPEGVRPSPSQQDLPLLLILPGITGSSEESYCTHLVQDGIVAGYRPVVFNQRGFGGVPLKVGWQLRPLFLYYFLS